MQDLIDSISPAIDLAQLRRVTFADRAFRDEVLGLFTNEANALLKRLDTAATDADWRLAAHTLKGMARGVGAGPLADAAAALEPLVNGERLERRSGEIAIIRCLVAAATAEARRLMAEP
jgi:HPt (histidine-containing phosphotransfer) domain-containing protein